MWPPQASCVPALALALGLGTIAPASSASYDTTNATGLADSQTLNDPFPYYFPRQDASPASLFAMPSCHDVDIEEATIDELQRYMDSGKLTSVYLVTCYMQRSSQTAEYIK